MGDDVAPVDLDRGFAKVERRLREQQLRTTPLAIGERPVLAPRPPPAEGVCVWAPARA